MKTNPEDVISLVVGTELDTYTFDSGPIEGGWDGTIVPGRRWRHQSGD